MSNGILHRIRIFRYLKDVDACVVTDRYRRIADSLGLTECKCRASRLDTRR